MPKRRLSEYRQYGKIAGLDESFLADSMSGVISSKPIVDPYEDDIFIYVKSKPPDPPPQGIVDPFESQDITKYPEELKQEMARTGRSALRDISSIATESAGAIGGAMRGAEAGAPLGPYGSLIGGVVGAGLGYMTAKTGESIASGEVPTAKDTLKSFLEGAMFETGSQSIGKVAGTIGEKFALLKMDEELLRLYRKFNISPLPSETLKVPSKTYAVLESVLGYSPFSGSVMIDYSVNRLAHLNNIRSQLVSRGASEKQLEYVGNEIKNTAREILGQYRGNAIAKVDDMVADFMNQLGAYGETKYMAGLSMKEVLSNTLKNKKQGISAAYDDAYKAMNLKPQELVPISDDTQTMVQKLYDTEAGKPSGFRNESLLARLRAFLPKREEGVENIPLFGGKTLTMDDIMANPQLKQLAGREGWLGGAERREYPWESFKQMRTNLNEWVDDIYSKNPKGTTEGRTYQMLADAIDDDMQKFAGTKGKDAWDAYLSARNESKKMHQIYNEDALKIMSAKPQDILSRVIGRNDVALAKAIKEGVGADAIDAIRNTFMKDAFEMAVSKEGMIDPQRLSRAIRKMSPDMQNVLFSTDQRSALSSLVKNAEVLNNKYFTQNKMKTVKFLETIMGLSSEKVVKFLFKPENRRNIRFAKLLLPENQIRNIQEQALQRVLITTPEGNFLPASSAREFTRYKNTLDELVGPEATKDVGDFLRITGNMKKIENLATNASQTGQVFVGYQIMQQMLNAPLRAMKSMGTPWLVAKMYTSDVARKLIKEALLYPTTHPQAVSNFILANEIAIMDIIKFADEKYHASEPYYKEAVK